MIFIVTSIENSGIAYKERHHIIWQADKIRWLRSKPENSKEPFLSYGEEKAQIQDVVKVQCIFSQEPGSGRWMLTALYNVFRYMVQ